MFPIKSIKIIKNKILALATGLGILVFLPSMALSQTATLLSINLSNTNPAPGSTVAVTLVYCDTNTYSIPYFLVGITPSSNTVLSGCALPQQYLLVDSTSPGEGTTFDGTAGSVITSPNNDGSDGNGWIGASTGGTPVCPVTEVWSVTIPPSLSAGSFNIVVAEHDYNVQCQSGFPNTIWKGVTVPFPPPAISTFNKSAEGNTATPGDLILFRMDYTYVNTGPVTITDTLPSQVSLAAANGSEISSGGNIGGFPTVTWVLPFSNAAVSGYVWVLAKVNAGVTGEISNTATAKSTTAGPVSSTTTVEVGGKFQLAKSQSSATINAGDTETYTLNYSIGGTSLQTSDSYNNDTVGTSWYGSTVPGSTGYDGTGYNSTDPNNAVTWSIKNDPVTEGNYIDVQTWANNNTDGYVPLLRNTPQSPFCPAGNVFEVEGDVNIPSLLQSGAANAVGEDATLAVMVQAAAPHYGFELILSRDNAPGFFALQENSAANAYKAVVTVNTGFKSPAMSGNPPVSADTWYTIKAQVIHLASGSIEIKAVVWPVGTPEPVNQWDIDYTTTDASTGMACSGGQTWQYGFQSNPGSAAGVYSAGRDLYSNLRMFSDDPAVNVKVSDAVPTGITYSGASTALTSGPSPLLWQFSPVTIYDQTGAITWWGVASCAGESGSRMSPRSMMISPRPQ